MARTLASCLGNEYCQLSLEESSDEPRYLMMFNDHDYHRFDVYLTCPDTGVYRYKLVKLRVQIPVGFPRDPPIVTFIRRTRHPIHPHFYPNGKVDLGFLCNSNDGHSWQDQQWEVRKLCHNMLLRIRELLDANPFMHELEPRANDNHELNSFVEYVTWGLLLDYLADEREAEARVWLNAYVRKEGWSMLNELYRQRDVNSHRQHFISPDHEQIPANYQSLIDRLKAAIDKAQLPRDNIPPGFTPLKWELEQAWTASAARGNDAAGPDTETSHVVSGQPDTNTEGDHENDTEGDHEYDTEGDYENDTEGDYDTSGDYENDTEGD